VYVLTLLYNSCLIQQSTSRTVHSHFSPGNAHEFMRTGGRRQQNGRLPTETGNLLFKDIILACSASAIIQLLPHVRLQEQGVVARPTRERSALQALHEPPPPTASRFTSIWPTTYAGTPSVLYRRLSSCSPWIIVSIGVDPVEPAKKSFSSSSCLRHIHCCGV
jgi:hypothetical protein